MKLALISLLLVATVTLAQAQAPAAPSKKAVPAAAKPKAKVKAEPKAAAVGPPVTEAALGLVELDIAERVQVGHMPCELGASVNLTADPKTPGHFDLLIRKLKYRMVPVPTTTGAIRLEDAKAGAVWLQLANKSMLMNHKLGQRMADECVSPQQLVVAEQLKLNPARSVLEAPEGQIAGAAAGLGAAPVTAPVATSVPALPAASATPAP